MNHWLIMPVLLPAMLAPLIILWMRKDLVLQRVFSTAGTATLVLIGAYLVWLAGQGEILVYRMGNWAAPFGITLVLDRLSAMMVFLTASLALLVQLYVIGSGWDAKGRHFHSLYQFQLMGIGGAFLTGDAFNLFVFFEVLLIASYGLVIHGGGKLRLKAGVQYVVYNLIGSTLFLAALGTIYSVAGTLNMADLAARVAMLPAGDTALIRTGAVLLMLVFAVKAALVPLHFWLPSTYAGAPGPVAALFAIMTKVGVYALIRFYTLIFPPEGVMGNLATNLLLPAALLTLIVGQLGILGGRNLSRMAAYAAIGSVGTLVIAVAPFTQETTAAALWYLPHSTFAAASLFLVSDMVASRRGGDVWLHPLAPIAQSGLVAAFFFATAIAIAGLPPLSGFVGKLIILTAFAGHSWQWWIWGTVLVTSLFAIIGFSRAGTLLFWKSHEADTDGSTVLQDEEVRQLITASPSPALGFIALGGMLGALVLMAVFAGPLAEAAGKTADQLYHPQRYIEAVMQNQGAVR